MLFPNQKPLENNRPSFIVLENKEKQSKSIYEKPKFIGIINDKKIEK